MTKEYIELFKQLAQSSEVISEQIMELDRQKNDEEGLKTAEIMRADYSNLYDRLQGENPILTKNDFAKLFVSSFIVTNRLEDLVANYKKVIDNYKLLVSPKLQRILEETQTNEEALKLANEIFQTNI